NPKRLAGIQTGRTGPEGTTMGSFHLSTIRTLVAAVVLTLVVGTTAWGQKVERENKHKDSGPVQVNKNPVIVAESEPRTPATAAPKTAAPVPGSYEQPVVDPNSAASAGDIIKVLAGIIGICWLMALRNWLIRLPFRLLGSMLGR